MLKTIKQMTKVELIHIVDTQNAKLEASRQIEQEYRREIIAKNVLLCELEEAKDSLIANYNCISASIEEWKRKAKKQSEVLKAIRAVAVLVD
jgi:hypothetical protein